MIKEFPFFKQFDSIDCGPSCLKMISKYYGRNISIQRIRGISNLSKRGTSFLSLCEAADSLGFKSIAVKIDLAALTKKETPFPIILHWQQKHYIVLHKFKGGKFYIADPAIGRLKLQKREFLEYWLGNTETNKGLAILIEPTKKFYESENEIESFGIKNFSGFYLKRYKKYILQILVSILLASVLQLAIPFLTQSVVDIGIKNQDINFIGLILIAQIAVLLGRTSVDFIRSWLLLHLGTRINFSILSDFLEKLIRLPISFFQSKVIGDLLQRVNDHKRIETFLTKTVLNSVFSFFNIIVFSIVLGLYSYKLLLVFFIGSALYIFWVLFFLQKREKLDNQRFTSVADNQNYLIQFFSGMREIKLFNNEKYKKWHWESIQGRLFKINIKFLTLNQYQQAGSIFINEIKNLIITYIAAKAVIDGSITLGMLIAIQYIVGQLNSPVNQFISFLFEFQDAKISIGRINEIHQKEDEEPISKPYSSLSEIEDIQFQNVYFSYTNNENDLVIKNISLSVKKGKSTAIVGASGSGKTTLINLLLKIINPTRGQIKIGNVDIDDIKTSDWRSKVGSVLQNGFIFSDTIRNNITLEQEDFDEIKFKHACEVSNCTAFIEELPLNYDTLIGDEGIGLSQGQRQRLLIARAVYRNPQLLIFDEATNALDSNNEKEIVDNLSEFFVNRTVVVVAHRLSTVKNADIIVVLDKGTIVEEGTHTELIAYKGYYYNLVQNQLELA